MKNKTMKKLLPLITAAALIIICGLVSRFAFQLAIIQGDSMKPVYHNFQFVFINRIKDDYNYGDVIALKLDSKHTIVKRIAALPGDTVEIKDGAVIVNGKANPVYSGCTVAFGGTAEKPFTLGKDEYFVIGDNFAVSTDSRYDEVGAIEKSRIIGKVIPQKELNK